MNTTSINKFELTQFKYIANILLSKNFHSELCTLEQKIPIKNNPKAVRILLGNEQEKLVTRFMKEFSYRERKMVAGDISHDDCMNGDLIYNDFFKIDLKVSSPLNSSCLGSISRSSLTYFDPQGYYLLLSYDCSKVALINHQYLMDNINKDTIINKEVILYKDIYSWFILDKNKKAFFWDNKYAFKEGF